MFKSKYTTGGTKIATTLKETAENYELVSKYEEGPGSIFQDGIDRRQVSRHLLQPDILFLPIYWGSVLTTSGCSRSFSILSLMLSFS